MTSKGVYEGFAIPGPGAVMVKTPSGPGYRAAHVDPKAFFAPGRTEWTNQELITAYGTHDTLIIGDAWVDQHDYAAIVLVNPPVGSNLLELSATIIRDTPRLVTILDPAGEPVVGVETRGLTAFPWDPSLRSARRPSRSPSFIPTAAGESRSSKEDRKLVGFLLARGDGDSPYTVQLANPGRPSPGALSTRTAIPLPRRTEIDGRARRRNVGTNHRFSSRRIDEPGFGSIS